MDRNFLEFWGNFLINAAKSQDRLEDMAKWMAQGFKGFEELSGMFRKFYGLDGVDENTTQYVKQWQEAAVQFQESFKDYLGLMGVVSKEDHLSLVKKYEDLKARFGDQEETIKHLRMLLDQRGSSDETVSRIFQDLMSKQADDFQNLMKKLQKFTANESPSNED
jgi:hypothetical protein